ncbi:ABC transporter ATP-binding protein [bacterium (Candidatus Blackallbacteria) CG17_big_fil_post_rev_8_21_14_2_50_48_46]|uniref:ABC transporter ATP-binding protein n=1 Tax=bacterium (Candidatus Blackallbacteria) CG17_big_fil_post_rev_8_21_14_2_50_48_46 TaxID=2014261 RepID=A0A2M7GBJ7_9BACT|nr:MAG: ABC transporter [bacterium (Candidatus Blackallbacteria) CG18_big_fil_WC_8_21_14_2_50_49_26]PIW19313.1 MAG: ABC transporter ATP-binding protein [bacterium (Candidatus Blackallbacteria) CG17_big_fil_post_rev_8_21_14_2_50_48_46]PIW49083.1 MAG: ABC transporter ATP-binding protein [bacterium (Candidatus Blackallbacteria) CG13_big_fil_rev_8_21_14_2_50_49_14]
MFAIECHEVCKTFQDGNWWSKQRKQFKAVDHVSFQVPKGEVFGLLGTNGSGKSTLIRMLSTLLLPDSGSVRIMGLDIEASAMEVRRLINRVAVDAAFFKKLSAWENLSYSARLYGIHPGQNRERIVGILTRLGLKEAKLHDSIEDMSRGMQQKVAIARALIAVPPVLLLDEPTTGLDPVSKREVRNFIREVRQDHATSILLTTHDMQEAEELCDRIAIMSEGRLVKVGSMEVLRAAAAKTHEEKQTLGLEEIFFRLTGKSIHEEGMTYVS